MSDTCICFPTLEDTGGEFIPEDTPAVVVEQFNPFSAVSAAVYVPYGTTAPGHVLSFRNGTIYWVIHPDHVSLEAAGAPPPGGDCAPALQIVFDYLLAPASGNRARLQLWERDYQLNSCATLNQTEPETDPVLYFSIVGRGRGVSRLVVPYPTNAVGAFVMTLSLNQSEFLARDFSVIATGATATNSGCGTAIKVNFTAGVDPTDSSGVHHKGAILSNLHIANNGVETDGVSWSYFVNGIDLTGTPRPLVSFVTLVGCDGDGVNGDYSDSGPRYLVQNHLILNECYEPYVVDCEMWHAAVGISCVSTTPVQGLFVSGNHLEGVKTRIVHSHMGDNPDGKLVDNSVQFRDFGFDLANIFKWHVSRNAFRNEGEPPTTSYDMRFQAATAVTLVGNDTGTMSNPDRVNILIDAETVVNGVNHGDKFLIESHQFGDGSAEFATSAILITESATTIQIGASNQFLGSFTGSVVDDPNNIATTAVGYPNSASAGPPTVLPSGSTPTEQPTLGSGETPWPATYNQTHYLPLNASGFTPISPSSGWVLYTDSDNNLLAENVDGTTRTLATP